MNKFAAFFWTTSATFMFSTGILSTLVQMDGDSPVSLTGLLVAFIPFSSAAVSIILYALVLSSKSPPCCNDTRHQEE